MTYEEAFPGFSLGSLVIPSDWLDRSDPRDVCPHWERSCGGGERVLVWIDREGMKDWMGEELAQFCVQVLDSQGKVAYGVLVTDDWEMVKAVVTGHINRLGRAG